MQRKICTQGAVLLATTIALAHASYAASCTTQSQMTSTERETLSNEARNIIHIVQTGDLPSLRAKALPAVAAGFGGIENFLQNLEPLVKSSTITVVNVFGLEAREPAGEARTQFFCGSPPVMLTFEGLPSGIYALVILHATGVPNPQQVSMILTKRSDDRWLLAGFYSKPMIEAGHDGLWYWSSARRYTQKKMTWNSWLYYRVATDLLAPIDFLQSPHLQKLQRETEQVRPDGLPGSAPMTIKVNDSSFTVTAIDTTAEFQSLDIDLHYTPSPSQVAELRDPPAARRQVTNLVTALVALHPELQDAFHGFWVHADQGNGNLFALELPMSGIVGGLPKQATSSTPSAR